MVEATQQKDPPRGFEIDITHPYLPKGRATGKPDRSSTETPPIPIKKPVTKPLGEPLKVIEAPKIGPVNPNSPPGTTIR
jgi:hypothetical protein